MPQRVLDFEAQRAGVVARRQATTLIASARTYPDPAPEGRATGAKNLRTSARKTLSLRDQREIWDLYDAVPEFGKACRFVGNLVSKAVLVPHYKGKVTTEQIALDAITSLFYGAEGQEEMLRLLGINFTAVGEAWVIGTPDPLGQDEWKVVASTKVTQAPSTVNGVRRETISIDGEPLGPSTLSTRLWRAHPADGNEPDSPAYALLGTLREIVLYTQVIESQAYSRLKGSGILWVPSELELPSVPTVSYEDGVEILAQQNVDSVSDSLTQRLIRVASVAIQNRESADANVPLVIAAPGEFLDKVQWTDFWTGFDEHVKSMRQDAIGRIGVGMDMPPEALSGVGDVNHWGAWQIEDSSIKQHTEPLLGIIVASLTTGYYQPLLRAWGVADWQQYTIEADTSALRARPNRSKESVELYDRGILNARRVLVENGFDPDSDAMTDQEYRLWLTGKVAGGSTTPDQVAAALRALGVQTIPGDSVDSTEARPTRSLDQHPTRDIPDPEESEAGQQRAIAAGAAVRPVIVDGLVMAAEQMVYRALERAGNRLKNKLDGRVKGNAADLYLSCPSMDYAECEALLEDAWTSVSRFSYGVSADRLQDALNEYTLMLLRQQKALSRSGLARHLMLELAEEQVA